MKRGYKHNTSVSGTDSEYYAASLFMMLRNPNGMRRPDLISVPDLYTPEISIELKSGKQMKGVLCESQLHYAVTLSEDYSYLFGEEANKKLEGLLPRLKNGSPTTIHFPADDIAFYYGFINRDGSLTAGDLDIPFASIRIEWGDQFIVPHMYGFYTFAVARHMRTGESLGNIVTSLVSTIHEDVRDGCSHYADRRADKQAWQNIHGYDILSIFHNNLEIAKRPFGVKRIDALRRVYPAVDDLKRIQIEGPNGTTIYVLAEPEHENLWDYQIRSVVNNRRSVIDAVAAERMRAKRLLKKVKYLPGETLKLFDDDADDEEEVKSKEGYVFCGSDRELNLLRRVITWAGKGEKPLYKHYLKDNDPPF